MSALLEKTTPTQTDDELVRRGQRVYSEKVRSLLEPEQHGQFVAIEPESERYFVGATGTAALIEARDAMPEHLFYLVRIGYEAADTLHSYGNRNR